MLDDLRAWLNGNRDYAAGVQLYAKLGDNLAFKHLLSKEKTDYNIKRLQQELQDICVTLKSKQYGQTNNTKPATGSTEKTSAPADGHEHRQAAETEGNAAVQTHIEKAPLNESLYIACRHEANKKYKEAMNIRAVLFKSVPSEVYADPNRQDLVEGRKDLALQTVILYNAASALYDRADYVKINGRLPDEPVNEEAEDVDSIPDHLVFYKMDGYRKNYNKLKAREQTPERIVQVQEYESSIKKLEERWHLLKSAQQ